MTFWLCTPWTVSAAKTPERYGSAEEPSQLRPPLTTVHAGPTTGPSMTLTPLRRFSPPRAMPRFRARSLFQLFLFYSLLASLSPHSHRVRKRLVAHLAPTPIPLAKPLTLSVARTPFPASLRHMPGKLSRGMPGMLPEHPDLRSTPPVKLTCSRISLAPYAPCWPSKSLPFLPASSGRPAPWPWRTHPPIHFGQ